MKACITIHTHTHAHTGVYTTGSSNFVPQDLLLPWYCTASPYIAMETQKWWLAWGFKWSRSRASESSQVKQNLLVDFSPAPHKKYLSGLFNTSKQPNQPSPGSIKEHETPPKIPPAHKKTTCLTHDQTEDTESRSPSWSTLKTYKRCIHLRCSCVKWRLERLTHILQNYWNQNKFEEMKTF